MNPSPSGCRGILFCSAVRFGRRRKLIGNKGRQAGALGLVSWHNPSNAKCNPMYIFLSHSARDKGFVRQLADSLNFYGIPTFFDEREIKIGDNIPAKIYNGLEKATHVIYVISNNSIQSEWVREELSVAKMRQMNKAGCSILPILLDDVSPPSSISHIKYANFKRWELKESYLTSLQELLESLEIRTHCSSSAELRFFQNNMHHLMMILRFSSTASQTYFQLERLYHYFFNRQYSTARWWVHETVNKTWELNKFMNTCQALEDEKNDIALDSEKLDKFFTLCRAIKDDYMFLDKSCDSSDLYYKRVLRAEVCATELTMFITSVMIELQSMLSK